MKFITDPTKTLDERKVLLKKAEAENVPWEKEYKKRIEAIKKAHKDEVEAINAQAN